MPPVPAAFQLEIDDLNRGIETGLDGGLFISSDAFGVIIAVGYNGG
jgi:hypothetical protein